MKHLPIAIISLFALILISCDSKSYRNADGAAWGTTYHIKYNADKDLSDSVVAEMRRVELSLSMFDAQSLISRINRNETDSVDGYLLSVFKTAKRVNRASDGYFDPTVAPLVDLWGFGRKGRKVETPDSAAVAQALNRVGLKKCFIADGKMVKDNSEIEFDFSAIAKGFGVDCIASMLRRNGCTDYMVEVGGEISLSGLNPHGEKWNIQIDAPTAKSVGDESLMMLKLTDCAIASSGNYRNYRKLEGDSVVGHTIDPLTGYPRATNVLSATVIAPTCALADAMATSLMLLPDDKAEKLVKSFPSTRAIVAIATPDSLKIVEY